MKSSVSGKHSLSLHLNKKLNAQFTLQFHYPGEESALELGPVITVSPLSDARQCATCNYWMTNAKGGNAPTWPDRRNR